METIGNKRIGWSVKIWEVGRREDIPVKTCYMSETIDRESVEKHFGCHQPDVEKFEIEEIYEGEETWKEVPKYYGCDWLKKELLECIDKHCYHYCGARWTDIGEPGKLVNMLNSFFLKHNSLPCAGVRNEKYHRGIDSPRNICNGYTTSDVVLVYKGKEIILQTYYSQIFGACVERDGEKMMEANEVGIDISDDFIALLDSMLTEKRNNE